MKLPDGDRAVVDDAKVRDYLLSPEHPIDRFKPRVLVAVGYRREHWQHRKADVIARTERRPRCQFVTVWLIPSEGAPPRLFTAYPSAPL